MSKGLLQLLRHLVQAFCDRTDLVKPSGKRPHTCLTFQEFPCVRRTILASTPVQGVDFTADNQAGHSLYRHEVAGCQIHFGDAREKL